ncbi:hypothetical protein [Desulforamulus aquiferis]|uniref:50S ribosomal protein L9 n=1 Tax=Desulforamulus aquiferis TaxID=1397668 RepID=A0AAW7ZDU7_9FIRM|nr:hypothetical protein [Desulforamulus aquiferis]MDO7787561.1 hypothetical protein [Desulforamulus aquiferis]
MFNKADFWIGLGVGLVTGVLGYKVITENKDKINTLLEAPRLEAGDIQLEELMRQKERLEDLIAEKQVSPS